MNAVNPVPAAAAAEPSMEEILASIRRIIADDQSLPGHAPPSAPRHAAADEPPGPTRPGPAELEARRVMLAEPTAAEPGDLPPEHGIVTPQFPSPEGPASVMDTPHPLDPRHSGSVEAEAPGAPEIFREPEPDVHEAALRDMHDEPGVHLHDFASQEPPMPAQDMPAQDMPAQDMPALDVTAHDMPARMHDTSAHDVPAHEVAGEAPGGLFSAATSQSLAAAFNTLAVSRLAADSAELRGLAQEMLRPMLKDWLDENLPGMVEGIIRDEIDRMSHRPR